MYEYAATVLRIVDGDTLHATIDLGFDQRVDKTLRLAGIDAPEKNTPEGFAALAWLEQRLALSGMRVLITTEKDRREKYGRYLAWLVDGEDSINMQMIDAGHAVPYDGGKR